MFKIFRRELKFSVNNTILYTFSSKPMLVELSETVVQDCFLCLIFISPNILLFRNSLQATPVDFITTSKLKSAIEELIEVEVAAIDTKSSTGFSILDNSLCFLDLFLNLMFQSSN